MRTAPHTTRCGGRFPNPENPQYYRGDVYVSFPDGRDLNSASCPGNDAMIGLTEGDSGDGVDGEYGPSTTRAVLAARRYVGSEADDGSYINYYAAAQIGRAVDRREAERVLADA